MKNYFSFSLYKQGIKRTRGAGIAAVATTVVLNFLFAFVTTQNASQYAELFDGTSATYYIDKMDGTSIAPFLILMFLFTPALCFSMFSYLNERKGADFYDAIPQKRLTIFTSFTAGIFTWILSALIISTTVNSIMWAISPHHSVSVGSSALLVLNYFVSMMVLAGVVLICRSLSGRGSFVLDFALSILFVPRIMLSFFETYISELNPIVVLDSTFLGIFSLKNSFFAVGNLGSDSASDLARIPLIVGLFIEGALFIVLAAYLYHKRESQIASQGVSSQRVKIFFRALLTLPLAFLIIITDTFVLLVVLITLTILLHFLYELFLTKEVKKALFSLPYLFVPFLISLALLLGTHVSSNLFIKADPAAEEVESIHISAEYYYDDRYIDFDNKTFIQEESIIAATSALEKSYSRIEEAGYRRTYARFVVEYTLENGKKLSRNVLFSHEELNALIAEVNAGRL